MTGYDQSILEFDFDQEKLNPPLEARLFQFRMPPGAALVENAPITWPNSCSSTPTRAAQIHQQVANAGSERELRDRYTQQGFLVYSIKTGRDCRRPLDRLLQAQEKLNLEKFLIFNQQFVTLIRAGLPILKALDLLAERLTDPKLGPYIKAVRDEVRNGTLLSDAFRSRAFSPRSTSPR